MKQILPVLFLFLVFLALFSPPPTHATISFQISNHKREGDYFIIEASISGISSSSAFIQGMFTNQSSSDYFGQTWGQKEDWVDYQTTNKDFILSNLPILLRDTSQLIWVRPNYENSGYKGPGDYDFKFKRFTGGGDSSAGESNKLVITLLEPLPTPISTPTPTPSDTPTPTPTITPTPTAEFLVTLNPTKTPTPTTIKTPTQSPTSAPVITASPSVILAKAGTQNLIPLNASSSSLELSSSSGLVLGDSSDSDIIEPEISAIQPVKSPLANPVALKYTFVFGIVIVSLSGGLLYFRHRSD